MCAQQQQASAADPIAAKAPAASAAPMDPDTFQRIGQLTRVLHDALRELGYDRRVEEAARGLPDAQHRLAYIATLTGGAAERVLGAVEAGQALNETTDRAAQALEAHCARVASAAHDAKAEAFVVEVQAFVRQVRASAAEQQQLLTEIMMAQDFHDLTGQVIKRLTGVARSIEANLVQVLLAAAVSDEPPEPEAGLAGPVVRAEGRRDVVTSQAQVDDLLESLGF